MREGKEKRLWFQKATESGISISILTNEQNSGGKTLQETLPASVDYKALLSHVRSKIWSKFESFVMYWETAALFPSA